MTDNSYTVFNAMADIVASPGKALDEIKQHKSWFWWPLLINILLACGLMIYYFSWVDSPWLIDEAIRQLPAENRAEAGEGVRMFMQSGWQTWVTVISIVVMSFIIYALQALYLNLANKLITGSEIKYGQWFSFSVWTAFVGVFATLAAFITILMADSNQLSQQSLQVLSLNSLLIHAAPGEPWFAWASSWTLINFWSLFLMSIGFARWTGTPIVKSTIIACLPWVVIFGVWALTI
ncbi:MAG: hypothetical protein GY732_05505 [Gammaproteobacteria bacterium]|nr:hypothetical protein [Gammaproteobacteria bacterium]